MKINYVNMVYFEILFLNLMELLIILQQENKNDMDDIYDKIIQIKMIKVLIYDELLMNYFEYFYQLTLILNHK